MVDRILCEQQLSALEFQTTQAYDALKRAVETHNLQDAVWVEQLYNTSLQKSLNSATSYSNYMGFQRDQIPIGLDKIILQYAIGGIFSVVLENLAQERACGRQRKAERTAVTEESLTQAIISGVPYIELKSMALKLAKAHKYDTIVAVLTYVREQYQRPTE